MKRFNKNIVRLALVAVRWINYLLFYLTSTAILGLKFAIF